MGFEIEASHHEVAAGQHEIDFKYADALSAADNIMTFKLAVKTLAQKNGLHATFMPKPVFGINGSGMHTNMSLFKDGKNMFFDDRRSRAGSVRDGLQPSSPGMLRPTCKRHGGHHQPAGQQLQAAGAGLRGPLLSGVVGLATARR